MRGRLDALISDCDGVIAETERDGHRVAFNKAFAERSLAIEWDEEEYGRLLQIAGGKERIKAYFAEHTEFQDCLRDAFIAELHQRKTEIFMAMCMTGTLPVRSGIRRLFAEARECGLPVIVCSTSNERSVTSLVRAVFGEEYARTIRAILAGDIVRRKKPAPDIYRVASREFGLRAEACYVIEDSRNGLLAAKGAGMACLVTPSFYSSDEDFSQADLVVTTLGDPPQDRTRVLKGPPGFPLDMDRVTVGMLEMCLAW